MDTHIGIVDDNHFVVRLIEDILRYERIKTITSFTKPYQALASFLKNSPPYSLIIADYHMPGISGLELLNHIRIVHPTIRGIIISADPDTVYRNNPVWPVVDKSGRLFQRELVRMVVRELTERDGGMCIRDSCRICCDFG